MIREAKAIFVSTIPNESPCSGGGDSMVYEMDACSGGRLAQPQFDMNSDRLIDESDKVEITEEGGTEQVPPTALSFSGVLYPPVLLRMPDGKREIKIFSTSAATLVSLYETAEKRGIFYWMEITE